MIDAEGKVFIPMSEFWVFVSQYMPDYHWETLMGVPRVEGSDLVIDYAASTECHPKNWVKPSRAAQQWDALALAETGGRPSPQ